MKLFTITYRDNKTVKKKQFETVLEGFQWVIKNITLEEDRKYYKDCCGLNFEEVDTNNERLMQAVLDNSFQNVISTCWLERRLEWLE